MDKLDEFLRNNILLIRVLEAENNCDINFNNDKEIASYVLKIDRKINDLKKLCNELIIIKEGRDNEIIKYNKNEEQRVRCKKLKDMDDEYMKKNTSVEVLERENNCIREEIKNKKIELRQIQEKSENEKKKIIVIRKQEQEFYNKSLKKCYEINYLEDNVEMIKENEKEINNTIKEDEKNIKLLEGYLKNILQILHKCQRSYEKWIIGEEEDDEKLFNLIDIELKNLKKIQYDIGLGDSDKISYEEYLENSKSEEEMKNLEVEFKEITETINENIKQLNDLETEIYYHQLKKLEKQLLYAEVKARVDIQRFKEKRLQQIATIEKILPKPTLYQSYKSNHLKNVVPMIYTDDVVGEDTFDDPINGIKGKELKKINNEVENNKVLIDNMKEELKSNLELRMATLLAEDDENLHILVEELSKSITSSNTKIPNNVLTQRAKLLKEILNDGISLLQDEKLLLQKKLSLIVNEVNDHHSLIKQLQSNISMKEKNHNKCIKNKIINDMKYKSIDERMINNNYEEYQEVIEKTRKQEDEINELKKSYEWVTKQRNEKKVELNQKRVDNSNISNKLKVATKKYEDNVKQLHQEEVIEEVIVQLENDILSLKKEINEKGEMLKKLEDANELLRKEVKEIELDREFNITA
uniref:DNA double-strand break repair Rad50 ATPase n=1 Tax=Strongyloides venezuelensis TaxID=75913 RepID=A0A0K0FE56_STRVS